jgi:hypothetical protein
MRKKSFLKPLVILISLVIIAGLSLFVLELTNTTHFFHKSVKTLSATQPDKSTTSPSSSPNLSTPAASSSSSTKSTAPASSASKSNSSASPAAPTGNFVSNHHPQLSSQIYRQEISVCVTTPGATCYIEFTQGNQINKLPVETADSNGAAYWNWDVQQAGFTTGSWKITAVASNDGQSITSSDPQDLVVSQ